MQKENLALKEIIYSRKLEREDQSACQYYLDASNTQGEFSIIGILQGSELRSASQLLTFFDPGMLKKLNAALLIVEKPGITHTNFDKDCYLRMNSLDRRAQDFEMVLNHIRVTNPEWNNKLFLCGISEGATLGAFLSERLVETKGLIMFSGGCGMTLCDEILLLELKKPSMGIVDISKKYGMMCYIKIMIFLAKIFPNSTYTCIGGTNTLKYWNSIAHYNPASSLQKLSIPLYLAHGSSDVDCPIESAEALVNSFAQLKKTNLYFQRYENLDHNYFDSDGKTYWNSVIDDAFAWALSNIH